MKIDKTGLIHLVTAITLIIIIFGVTALNPVLLRILGVIHGPWGAVPAAKISDFEFKLKGLHDKVYVYYDKYGVPYIQAENFYDLYMVFGFIQARDRLFQMDISRRLASGRLSELFGPDLVETDKFYRIIGLHRASQLTYNELLKDKRNRFLVEYLQAFANGVNAYIDHAIKNNVLPIEYRLLGLLPEYWTPVDSIVIGRLISWQLTGTFEDIELKQFLQVNGYEALLELDILNRTLNTPILRSGFKHDIKVSGGNVYADDGQDAKPILNMYYSSMPPPNIIYPFISNNWVISGNLSFNKYPIIANDPHLWLVAPPVWYEACQIIPGKLYIRGVTFPGIPLIIIGRNLHVAWGFTNVGADVIDFYYYKWRDGKYLYRGKWMEVISIDENIRIWVDGRYVTEPFKVNMTVHGPLIEKYDVKYAIKWTGHLATMELVAFYYFNVAEDIYDFIEGQKYFMVPAQNAVIADDKCNIAYYPAALYPIRGNTPIITFQNYNITNYGFLPFNGSKGEGEWIGFIPFEEIPHAINPPEGYVVTANNKVIGPKYPYYLTWSWSDRFRYDRINIMLHDLIKRKGYITIEDIKEIQTDIYSIAAEVFLQLFYEVINEDILDDVEALALSKLKEWDYMMVKDGVAPTIYIAWLTEFHKLLWIDEFEAAGIKNIKFLPLEISEWILRKALAGEEWVDRWIDMDLSELVTKSYKNAISILRKEYGDDVSKWTWSKSCIYKIEHPMGNVLPWLNYPLIPASGGPFTVSPAGISLTPPKYRVVVSASIRFIANLEDASAKNNYLILPGGNIGNPFNIHYYDQLYNYVNMSYRQIYIPLSIEDVINVKAKIVFIGG